MNAAYNTTMILEDAKDLPADVKLAVAGTGHLALACKRWLEKSRPDLTVVCFVGHLHGQELDGIPIVAPGHSPEWYKIFQILVMQERAQLHYSNMLLMAGQGGGWLLDYPIRLELVESQTSKAVPLERSSLVAGATVAIYGAGGRGREARDWLMKNRADVRIACFLDTHQAGELEGLPVHESSCLQETRMKSEFDAVIIASSFSAEIEEVLLRLGWERSYLYEPVTTMSQEERLRKDIASNHEIWRGGYAEGDPLDPLGGSSYGALGWVSVLNLVYRLCIEPYVNAQTTAVEIGCGRGAWSRCILKHSPKELHCLDALSAKDNRFHHFTPPQASLHYHQVRDFSCSQLPEGQCDYLFSFGCFCHLPPEGVRAYLENLRLRLAPNAHGFIMFADYDKFNHAIAAHRYSLLRLVPPGIRGALTPWLKGLDHPLMDKRESRSPSPGRWYHLGVETMTAWLEELGYRVITGDMDILPRDPIVHFQWDKK